MEYYTCTFAPCTNPFFRNVLVGKASVSACNNSHDYAITGAHTPLTVKVGVVIKPQAKNSIKMTMVA